MELGGRRQRAADKPRSSSSSAGPARGPALNPPARKQNGKKKDIPRKAPEGRLFEQVPIRLMKLDAPCRARSPMRIQMQRELGLNPTFGWNVKVSKKMHTQTPEAIRQREAPEVRLWSYRATCADCAISGPGKRCSVSITGEAKHGADAIRLSAKGKHDWGKPSWPWKVDGETVCEVV